MKTVICTQIKDEERYIKEWIDYYLNLGIYHIYLFEDYGSRSHKELLRDYKQVTVQTVEEFGIKNYYTSRTQTEVCRKFFKEAKVNNLCDWILFIDADEFVHLEEGYTLDKIEELYKDYPALLLSWKNYGASGHIKRPEGGVVENYTIPGQLTETDYQWTKKSLVNVNLCTGLKNIHIAEGAVDVEGNTDEHAPSVYKKIWINHYFTKSWEDFCERIFERGNMSNNYRTLDNFFKCNPDLAYMDKELIYSVRFRKCKSTMWLSKKYKLISGGNLQ